jgi:class 3 adenylate cyclase
MALKDELENYVGETFKSQWTVTDAQVVPDPADITLDNSASHFELATVLYADLDGSTSMVTSNNWQFASEIYKNYLYCCSRLIRSEGGEITAYDGDRVMGIFIGGSQSSNAARCALKINYVVKALINPAIRKQYSSSSFQVSQCVGIDTSEIHAARTGVRGDNDLVWVGRAANYAAKLTELANDAPSWITKSVYDRLSEDAKFGGTEKKNMWEERSWTAMGGTSIYRSSWWWEI